MNIDWLSAIGMILAGVIVGFMFVYSMRRSDKKPAAKDSELRDLEAKRDTLLAALRELADTKGDASERARLERQAAEVLKAIDARSVPRSSKVPRVPRGTAAEEPKNRGPEELAPRPVSSTRATIKGFAWGAASIAVLGGIAWFVTQSAKPKTDGGMQQASAMGAPQTQSAPQAPSNDPVVLNLEASVKKNPDDLNARIELAKAYLDRENAMGTYEQTQYVLERSPKDPKALTYQAIVRIAMGQADQARQMLETASKEDPKLLDASVALAWAYTVGGRNDDAERVMTAAAKQHPEEKQRLDELLQQMRARQKEAANRPPMQHPPIPGAPDAAQAADAPPSQASAASAPISNDPPIHVTVKLSPSVKVPATAVLWIMARDNGSAAGPPLAVKKAMPSQTIQVDLSANDSMMGQPLPKQVRIEARLDLDGNPMTHDANDPTAFQDGVGPGATVMLTLK